MISPEEQSVNEAVDADVANDDADVFQLALARYDAITSATQEERALNLQDRRFGTIAGAQWEDQWFQQFENSIRVEINKAALGAERISADYREHRMIVDFRPVDKGADDETADTMNGMFRADFYRSHGQQATDNAFDEAVYGGIGGWRLTTSYVDPYDPEDDRKQIDFVMVPDADQCMFFDLDAKLQSKADAKFGFLLSAMSPAAYRDAYDDDPASWPTNLLKTYYEWYTPEVVYVAEYYVVEERSQKRFNMLHKITGEEKTLWNADIDPEDLADMQTEGWKIDRTRSIPRRRIRKYILSANGIIGPKQGIIIAGDRIPLIPVYGKRWFVDNMERTRGHIRLAKDPQRVYNANVSKLVETASYSPIERPIVTPAQIAGHGDDWAAANINRSPYVQLNATIDPGTGLEMPLSQPPVLAAPNIPAATAALLQISAQDISELTQSDDGADQVQSNVSADAMEIAATRTDKRSLPYIDNMKQAWQACGEVWQSMARDVYVEEQREVDTIDQHEQQSTAILMEPKTDPKTGAFGYANDIHEGRYKVIADVTEATATRRDKTVKTLMNLAQITGPTDPELANAAVTTAILNMDGEGMTDFQDWNRKRALQSGLVQPTDEEKAEIAQAQQNAQPSPEQQVAAAKIENIQSSTGLNKAKTAQIADEIQGGQVDHAETQTRAVLNLANAKKSTSQAEHIGVLAHRDHKNGIMDRLKAAKDIMFPPQDKA